MPDLLEEAKRLSEAATPGPWTEWAGTGWPKWWLDYLRRDEDGTKADTTLDDENAGLGWPIASPEDMEKVDGYPTRVMAMARSAEDQRFIARARTLIPELVERVEQAEKNARRVEYAWENLRGWMPNGRGVPNWTREMNDAVGALAAQQRERE